MRTKRFDDKNLLLQSLIGKPLDGFNGFAIRVTREDSTIYMVTMDLRFDRIDVQIDSGIITKCNVV